MRKKTIILFLIFAMIFTSCAETTLSQGDYTESSPTQTEQKELSQTIKSIPEAENAQNSAYPPFTGIELSEKALSLSTANNKTGILGILCGSDDSDMIYFSNPDDNWRLYSYDGENAVRITDGRSHSLNYYDGSVYFLSASNYSVYENPKGVIFRYDVESGEITQISNDKGYDLRVNEYGIFYVKKEDEDIYYVYSVDPENGEEKRLYQGKSVYFLDDYAITRESSKTGKYWDYFLQSEEEKICILENCDFNSDFIHNGVFYYCDDSDKRYHSLDLRTGENKVTGTKHNVFIGDEEYFLEDVNTWGDDVYRRKDGKTKLVMINGEKITIGWHENFKRYTPCRLYSSGQTLYALVRPCDSDDMHYFAKLEIKEYDVSDDELFMQIVSGEIAELISISIIGEKED